MVKRLFLVVGHSRATNLIDSILIRLNALTEYLYLIPSIERSDFFPKLGIPLRPQQK